MPDFEHTINPYDTEMLRIIAMKWGLKTESLNRRELITDLVKEAISPARFQELLSNLTPLGKSCLSDMMRVGGRLPLGRFTRQFGELREMGIARRNRERPDEAPVSVTEELWYQGLIGRAFLEGPQGLQEYIYIPDNWMKNMPRESTEVGDREHLAAEPVDYRITYPVDDHILDHLTSLLIALRNGENPDELVSEFRQPSIPECIALLSTMGLADARGEVEPDRVRIFLSQPRGEALCTLFKAWFHDRNYNDLRYVPGLNLDGHYENYPEKTRSSIVEHIRNVSNQEWLLLDEFIALIKKSQPDFQRPAGNYDTWSISSRKTGESLRGYAHWDEVDGALVRYLICGPLHWLGITELGKSHKGKAPKAFRLSPWAGDLLSGNVVGGLSSEEGKLTVMRNGRITCPLDCSRVLRYQLARFCLRIDRDIRGYQYQLDHKSLTRAVSQGLQVDQFLSLISHHSASGLPSSLKKALTGWEQETAPVKIRTVVILQTNDPELMKELRESPLARFLGEFLSPNVAIISAETAGKLVPRLLELGFICEYQPDGVSVERNRD